MIVRVAALSFTGLGIIVSALFICFSGVIADFIGNRNSFATMITIAPSIVFVSLSGVIRGYLSADLKLFYVSVSQILEGVGKLATGLLFAILGTHLSLELPIISALTILGVTFGSWIGLTYLAIVSKIKIFGNKSRQKLNFSVLKRIFSISLPITFSALVLSLSSIVDLLMIMRNLRDMGYTESEASALYGNYTTLAIPMFNFAMSVITPISVAYLPIFTRLYKSQSFTSLDLALENSFDFISFIGAPILFLFSTFSNEILEILFGNSNIEVGAKLLYLLSPAIIFSSALLVINTLLESQGRVIAPVVSMILGCITKIALNTVLLSNSYYGIYAAPISTVFSYAISLIASLIFLSQKYKIRLSSFANFFSSYASAFISVTLGKVVYIHILEHLGITIRFFISLVITGIVYILISLLIGTISPKKVKEMSKYTKIAQKNY